MCYFRGAKTIPPVLIKVLLILERPQVLVKPVILP